MEQKIIIITDKGQKTCMVFVHLDMILGLQHNQQWLEVSSRRLGRGRKDRVRGS